MRLRCCKGQFSDGVYVPLHIERNGSCPYCNTIVCEDHWEYDDAATARVRAATPEAYDACVPAWMKEWILCKWRHEWGDMYSGVDKDRVELGAEHVGELFAFWTEHEDAAASTQEASVYNTAVD
jgi:hypothetical protein